MKSDYNYPPGWRHSDYERYIECDDLEVEVEVECEIDRRLEEVVDAQPPFIFITTRPLKYFR